MNNQQYSPSGFGILPPVVKNLIIINVLFYLATIAFGSAYNIDLVDKLGLHYFASQKFALYQFFTYMFMHGGMGHIFFNMFALWMFGSVLEQVWGPKRFLTYYIVTGIGAAVVHYVIYYFQINPVISQINVFLNHPDFNTLIQLINNHQFMIGDGSGEMSAMFAKFKEIDFEALKLNPNDTQAMQGAVSFLSEYKEYYLNQPVVVGASGAIYGLLLAFGMMFPNSLIYLYFFIPMKAKWFVIIFGIIELVSGFYESGSNVAHFAHLGGMIFGFLLLLYWRYEERKKYRHWQ